MWNIDIEYPIDTRRIKCCFGISNIRLIIREINVVNLSDRKWRRFSRFPSWNNISLSTYTFSRITFNEAPSYYTRYRRGERLGERRDEHKREKQLGRWRHYLSCNSGSTLGYGSALRNTPDAASSDYYESREHYLVHLRAKGFPWQKRNPNLRRQERVVSRCVEFSSIACEIWELTRNRATNDARVNFNQKCIYTYNIKELTTNIVYLY